MPNMTEVAVTAAVVGGAVGMAAMTGGAGVLIGSAVLAAAAYKTHDIVVGGMYDDNEQALKSALASCDKDDHGRKDIMAKNLKKTTGDRCLVKAASVGVGIGTFLCPPAGIACAAALVWGASRRLKQ